MGICNIQLAMAEHAINQVNASHLQCLPLRLVDHHGIAHPDRELDPLELEGKIRGNEQDPQDEDLLTMAADGEHGGLDCVWQQLLDDQSYPVAQSRRVKVPQQHDRNPLKS